MDAHIELLNELYLVHCHAYAYAERIGLSGSTTASTALTAASKPGAAPSGPSAVGPEPFMQYLLSLCAAAPTAATTTTALTTGGGSGSVFRTVWVPRYIQRLIALLSGSAGGSGKSAEEESKKKVSSAGSAAKSGAERAWLVYQYTVVRGGVECRW